MRTLIALSMVAMLAIGATAEEKAKGKKGAANSPVAKMVSEIKALDLTTEQSEKLAGVLASFEATMKTLRGEGLTADLQKKKAAAMKEAREAGLKGKEAAAKIGESLSAEEQALLAKVDSAIKEVKQAVAGMLTDEQMAALPEAVKKQLSAGPAPKKGKKNAA